MARNKYNVDETLENKFDISQLVRSLIYVKRYKKAFAKGGKRGERMEKRLDKAITQRSVGSYKRRVWIHDRYASVRNGLKNFLVNCMPKFYLFLRRQKHKKKAQA